MTQRAWRDSNGSVLFECPGCECPHAVDSRWTFNEDYERPTFSPSYLARCPGGPVEVCHSFVREGRIQFLSDSTHRLAGQTVDLPEVEP
jgi:hypothetical protein